MSIELMDLEPELQDTTPVGQALTLVNTQVAQFSALEAGFAELESRYKDVVYAVETPAGMEEAKKARQEIRQVRYNAQNLLDSTTKPLNQLKADIKLTANKIIDRVKLTEDPINKQITAVEDRKAAEKLAKEQEEAARAAKVQSLIDSIKIDAVIAVASAAEVSERIKAIQDIQIDLEIYGSRAGEAAQMKANALDILIKVYGTAVAREKHEAELAESRRQMEEAQAALDRERAAFAAEQADAKRKSEAEAQERARVEQAARDEAERVQREAAKAEQDRLDQIAAAERRRLDDEAESRRELERRADEQRRADEARVAANDKRVRDLAQELLIALIDMVALHEDEPDRPAVRYATSLIKQATGE